MKGVQCYELFGGIALKIHTFSCRCRHYSDRAALKSIKTSIGYLCSVVDRTLKCNSEIVGSHSLWMVTIEL